MSILQKIKEVYLEGKFSSFFWILAFMSLFLLILNTFLLDLVETQEYFFTPLYLIGLSIIFSIGTRQKEKAFKSDEEIEARDKHDEEMAMLGIPTGTNVAAMARWGYDIAGNKRINDTDDLL